MMKKPIWFYIINLLIIWPLALNQLRGVSAEVKTDDKQGMEPYVNVNWDQNEYKISKDDLKLALRNGNPCIELRAMFLSFGELHLTAHMLKKK